MSNRFQTRLGHLPHGYETWCVFDTSDGLSYPFGSKELCIEVARDAENGTTDIRRFLHDSGVQYYGLRY